MRGRYAGELASELKVDRVGCGVEAYKGVEKRDDNPLDNVPPLLMPHLVGEDP